MKNLLNVFRGFVAFGVGVVCTCAVMAGIATAAQGEYPSYITKVYTSVLTIGASGSGSTSSTTAGSWYRTKLLTLPALSAFAGYAHALSAHGSWTTAASANSDLIIQGRFCSTCAYVTLNANSGWTQVTTATSDQFRTYLGPIPPEVRAQITESGSQPSHSATVHLAIGG